MNPLHLASRAFSGPAFLCQLAAVLALAGVAPAAQAQRFAASASGQEVTDAQTGLTWRRCAEGMAWSGSTCTGSYGSFTHEQALVHARDQAGWRLPNAKELQSLVDKTRTAAPFIDVTAFPGTPGTVFWTSTPYAANPSSAWYVYFVNGYVNYSLRRHAYAVRLVRASQ
jgi:hypothetical protein